MAGKRKHKTPFSFFRRRNSAGSVIVGAPKKRQSEPSYQSPLETVSKLLGTIPPTLPAEVYTTMEKLWYLLPDMAHAVNNAVTLANPGHRLKILAPNERQAEAVQEELNALAPTAYIQPGGVDALIAKAFQQLFVKGAISAETVLKADLSGVDFACPVPVEKIRFQPGADGRFQPVQLTSLWSSGGFTALDPRTYLYMAPRTISDKPYAVPPFVTAITGFTRRLTVFEKVDAILDIMSLAGLLTIPIKRPDQNPTEDDEAYRKRAKKWMQDSLDAAVKGSSNGAVGDDYSSGMPRPQVVSTTSSAAGLREVMHVFDVDLASALLQGPAMMGREISQSETRFRFEYQVFINSLTTSKLAVKRFVEQLYRLHLACLGLEKVRVRLEWKPQNDLLAKEQAETDAVLQGIYLQDWLDGVISKEDYARLRGYDKPATGDPPWAERQAQAWTGTFENIGNHYEFLRPCVGRLALAADPNAELTGRAVRFLAGLSPFLAGARDDAVEAAAGLIAGSYTAEAFAKKAARVTGEAYHTRFTEADATDFVTGEARNAYVYYRLEDPSLLGGAGVPAWSRLDDRVAGLLSERPAYHLTKAVQTPATQDQLRNYLQHEFQERNLSARDSQALADFKEAFRDSLGEIADHRAGEIIDTGLSRIRTDAQVRQAYEHDPEMVLEWVEVMDENTCERCRRWHGTTVTAGAEHRRLEEDLRMSPEDYFRERDWRAYDASGATKSQIRGKGLALGPRHPHCRGRVRKKRR